VVTYLNSILQSEVPLFFAIVVFRYLGFMLPDADLEYKEYRLYLLWLNE